MNTSHKENETECGSDKMSLSLKKSPQGKETVKGITTQMLVLLGAFFVGAIVLFVVIEMANPNSSFVRTVLGFGKMICGLLSIMTGGWGTAVCNII